MFGTEAVEANGEGGLQPVHAAAQVGNRRRDGEMEMISEDGKCVNFPSEAEAGLSQRALERVGGASGVEQITAIVATVNDVVDGARELDSEATSHVTSGSLREDGRQFRLAPICGLGTNPSPPVRRQDSVGCNT